MEIRNIKDEDSKSIFKWRNNQETREMSFKTKKVSLKEHNKWFKESIQNSNRKLLIGEFNGIKLGVCKFDFNQEEFSAEVSINMNPEVRGKGYGKKLLSNAIRIYLEEKRCILKAKIKVKNYISIKLFSNIGFLTTKKENGFIFMELKENLKFKKINKEDASILYELLKTRKHNISHESLPDFKTHKKFIENNPYMHWYLFSLNGKFIGSFYIKDDNSIGINTNYPNKYIVDSILNYILVNFYPVKGIPSKTPNYFFINISATNKDLKNIIESLGYMPIQVSYRLENFE